MTPKCCLALMFLHRQMRIPMMFLDLDAAGARPSVAGILSAASIEGGHVSGPDCGPCPEQPLVLRQAKPW